MITKTEIFSDGYKDYKKHVIILDRGKDSIGRWTLRAYITDQTNEVNFCKYYNRQRMHWDVNRNTGHFIYPEFANHENWTMQQDKEFIDMLLNKVNHNINL